MTATRDPPSGATPRSTLAELHRDARYTRWFGRHLVATLVVFFASAFAGYAIGGAIPLEALQEFVADESVLPDIQFEFVPIMLNNLRALFLILSGAITFGTVSLFGLFTNGLIVGVVVGLVVQETSWVVILAALLPHGVIELSAFFMAASIGLRVPHRFVRFLLGWDETPLTRVELFELVVLTVVMVAMIVVAAWIEVTVTPGVVERVGGSSALAG